MVSGFAGEIFGQKKLLPWVFVIGICVWIPAALVCPVKSLGAGMGLQFEACIARGVPGCADLGMTLDKADLRVSPDNKSVYVVGDGAVVGFSRGMSGEFRFSGCMGRKLGVGTWIGQPRCQEVPNETLSDGPSILSPDGKHLYVVGGDGWEPNTALSTFDRKKSGALVYRGCLASRGDWGCRDNVTSIVGEFFGVSVSPDSRNVYVEIYDRVTGSYGIGVFRQPRAGSLRYQGCMTVAGKFCRPLRRPRLGEAFDLKFTPNGRTVITRAGGGLAVFRRGPRGNLRYQSCVEFPKALRKRGCGEYSVRSRNSISGFALGPRGHRLYVALKHGSLSTFRVSRIGKVKFVGCVANQGKAGCRSLPDGHLFNPGQLVVHPSGRKVFVNARRTVRVDRYDLGRVGRLRYHGCVSEEASDDCQNIDLENPTLTDISPDGRSYYFGNWYKWTVLTPDR